MEGALRAGVRLVDHRGQPLDQLAEALLHGRECPLGLEPLGRLAGDGDDLELAGLRVADRTADDVDSDVTAVRARDVERHAGLRALRRELLEPPARVGALVGVAEHVERVRAHELLGLAAVELA